jgi:uncharacterized membrane protein YdfJ with MMPL/SSD domain
VSHPQIVVVVLQVASGVYQDVRVVHEPEEVADALRVRARRPWSCRSWPRDTHLAQIAGMDDAIAHGIKSTAGVVTSAATVMVAVFSIFATLSMLIFKQFGVGLAAAILIDATLVRGVLLPATMKLLGERNWYLPKWLQWLPRLEEHELPSAPAARPAPASA